MALMVTDGYASSIGTQFNASPSGPRPRWRSDQEMASAVARNGRSSSGVNLWIATKKGNRKPRNG